MLHSSWCWIRFLSFPSSMKLEEGNFRDSVMITAAWTIIERGFMITNACNNYWQDITRHQMISAAVFASYRYRPLQHSTTILPCSESPIDWVWRTSNSVAAYTRTPYTQKQAALRKAPFSMHKNIHGTKNSYKFWQHAA